MTNDVNVLLDQNQVNWYVGPDGTTTPFLPYVPQTAPGNPDCPCYVCPFRKRRCNTFPHITWVARPGLGTNESENVYGGYQAVQSF